MGLKGWDIIRIIEVQIVSLKARKDRALNFSLNAAMHIEAELCQAQIDALLKEADEWRK